ncbi:MAG TPA: UvrD-helicase domain-containing protein, partial [Bacteroidota bacterium]|nr:UvrD-helicase domain-containing protein [Bacteroidota bacterium]
MQEILTPDSSLTLPDFMLVSASAGSGKTTALTRRFIQLLLSDRIPHNELRNILAITFTNNAAAEMKQRILGDLKKAYFGDAEVLSQFKNIVSLDEETIRKRAGTLVDTILDQYSDFQVQTIDSFLSRVLTVSTLEFGLPPGFEIVLNGDPLLEEAFDLMMMKLVSDPAQRHLLGELLNLLSETWSDKEKFLWNPYHNLLTEIKNLYAQLGGHAGSLAIGTKSGNLEKMRKEILDAIRSIGDLAGQSGFTVGKNYQKIIEAARAGDINSLLDKKLDQQVLNKSSNPAYEQTVKQIELLQAALMKNVTRYYEARAHIHYRPYVTAYRLLLDFLEEVEQKSGKLSLTDAIKKLATSLTSDAVPEIYFSLGERIHHFLIDEFQDTSPIQWATLRPLIENSLAQQGSLFIVGDTKQSIYTFRGGDWQIMKRMMTQEEFPSVARGMKELTTNYRSDEAIVAFTKKVFHEIVPQKIPLAIAEKSGLTSFQQEVKPPAQGKGFVEVYSVSRDKEHPDASPEKQKLLDILTDCRSRGFRYRDIAVLTPKNSDVVEVSRWLNEATIQFISHSSLDVRTRKITGELLALLKFLDSPVDDLSFATFILGNLFQTVTSTEGIHDDLSSSILSHRSGDNDDEPLYVHFRSLFPHLWEKYFESVFNRVGYLPLYDLLSDVYGTFSLFDKCPDEMSSLVKILEVVKNFEQSGSNNLKEFLTYAEEESDEADWNIDVSADTDAVTVMTVHKAKGLGFPVLIVLLYDGKSRADNLFLHEDADGIHLVRIIKKWAEQSAELSSIYREKNILRQVDDLNKLYVALTRAREEMYVLSIISDKFDMPSSLLPGNYSAGKQSPRKSVQDKSEHITDLAFIAGSVSPATTREGSINIAETQRGDFFHDVLQQIIFLDDDPISQITHAIEQSRQIANAGIDNEDIFHILQKFLEQPEIKKYFTRTDERIIRNEQEIGSSNGRLYRIDRLVVDHDLVTVIDYKTGGERTEYIDQVKEYIGLLKDVYPR